MRLVLDQLFIDTLDFKIPLVTARRCDATNRTMADVLKAACAEIGIELIDYETGRFVTFGGSDVTQVHLQSRAYNERVARGG